VGVFENREAMPRAFVLPLRASMIAQDPIEQMRRFDARHHVFLELDRHPDSIAADAVATPARHRAAVVSRYEDNRVDVEALVKERAWLVLADGYDPGWKAYGKNRETPDTQVELELYRVNGVMRGVVLDPGDWVISFHYRPRALYLGAVMSVLGGIGLLILAVIHFRYQGKPGRNRALSHV
jgi:hypothetical protein